MSAHAAHQTRPVELLTRRSFLRVAGGAGAGLIIGAAVALGMNRAVASEGAGDFMANQFVRVSPDGAVTVFVKHLEMGQGVFTGLPTLVAEELDADWTQVRAEFTPADPRRYNNLYFGDIQGTGASTSIANSFMQYREAGAMAKAMLIGAAAEHWGVPASEVTASEGLLKHSSGKEAGFGELADRAAAMPVPQRISLKDPEDFVLIGKHLPSLDTPSKIDGTALFTLDVKLDGMLTVVLARPPRFGGKVTAFGAREAKKVRGVVSVVDVPSGVAVIANGYWPAFKGRAALSVEWDDSAAETRGTDELFAEYKALAQTPGALVRADGDAEGAIARAATVLEAEFEFPYLAHAPMEPLDCVVRFDDDRAEVWAGSQIQSVDQFTVGAILGLPPEKVAVHTQMAGGSFGRRAIPDSHYVAEAASGAKAFGPAAPIRVVWSREDDIRGGYYRPMYVHRLRAGLDQDGKPVAWHHRIVGQSIFLGTPVEPRFVQEGIDSTSVDGAKDLPYEIDNIMLDRHTTRVEVPVLWWRSVGHAHNAHATEVFIDELAHARDATPSRSDWLLLRDHPRHTRVLRLAAEKAGWGTPLSAGKGRGVPVHESFRTFVAQVAEVSVRPDGNFKVDRVVCAVDCGVAVNPDIVRAQMEGGIGYGLGAALRNAVTLTDGLVDQSNFDDYEPLRIEDMPVVEVHIVPSAEQPTGVGEPGVPPIAPAVSNAIFAATGQRLRSLPFTRYNLVRA